MARLVRYVALAIGLGVLPAIGLAENLRDVPVHHTGTEFALRVILAEDSYPIVVHVDPHGGTAIVYPETSVASIARVSAGDPVVWPDPASDVVWTLSGDPGYETFILVACGDPHVDLVTLSAEIGAIDEAWRVAGEVRSTLITEVVEYLEDALGPVRATTILHLP